MEGYFYNQGVSSARPNHDAYNMFRVQKKKSIDLCPEFDNSLLKEMSLPN